MVIKEFEQQGNLIKLGDLIDLCGLSCVDLCRFVKRNLSKRKSDSSKDLIDVCGLPHLNKVTIIKHKELEFLMGI